MGGGWKWAPGLALAALGVVGVVRASDHAAPPRFSARANYALHCQGCHLPDGSGMPGKVPNMRGELNAFLRVPGGRDYIVQVPGAATSRLDDTELAGVMNWLVQTMGPDAPADFRPYTAEEVHTLRAHWLRAPAETRRQLMAARERLKQSTPQPETAESGKRADLPRGRPGHRR